MDLRLAQIVLYTHHKEDVTQFFSDLFDMDIIPVGDGVKLHHPNFHLVIVRADASIPKKRFPASIVLDFNVDAEEDLVSLHQKVQFLSYRHHFDFQATSEGAIQQHGKNQTFFLTDPDGRKWKFSFKGQ